MIRFIELFSFAFMLKFDVKVLRFMEFYKKLL